MREVAGTPLHGWNTQASVIVSWAGVSSTRALLHHSQDEATVNARAIAGQPPLCFRDINFARILLRKIKRSDQGSYVLCYRGLKHR